ncbi:MAG: FecR domain-containing protein [Gammaproteobacteria bacterium]
MSTHDPAPPDLGNRADYWARRMADASDTISDAERSDFSAWLLASEENEMDYRRSVGVLQLMASLPTSAQSALISPSGEGRSESDKVAGRRNILKLAGLAASVAIGLVAGGIYLENRGIFGESHSTRTGETSTVKFSEGSVAYLNTRTQLRWLGSGNDRRVELISGEALFDVVHDETRPFAVILDGSEIRVLGTRFNVYRKDSGDVVVTVLEGTVEVRGFAQGPSRSAWTRRVVANQQIEYRPIGLVSEPHGTDALRAVTWRSGLLQLPEEGETITSVIGELTRYTDKHIIIRDPQLANLKVGGAFNTRDVKGALQKLQMGVPTLAVEESEGLYTLDVRPSGTERN